MPAPQAIHDLIERFERNFEGYKSPQYNETQLRREFIDPFFEALGWDVTNKQGFAEPYKEVIHEDAVKIGTATKAPDYSFRIGGTRKFFVETKKPSLNLKEDPSPAFQLRRYAWSAKLPLSVLTDFEEFVVYDCRMKPAKSDSAATARVKYSTFKEYVDRWDEIASVFSKEALHKGSFDKYAESTKVKKGTAEVDDAFLKEIESWRDMLARNIALRNPKLDHRELNFAVQRTIDRIIFLRICEDRGIETYGQLMALLNGERVYRRLSEILRRADEKYNSGLFHFEEERGRSEPPDELTLGLTIDDKPLKEIIQGLYYPDSPYEFSVLSADILGQVYEQFLGKVIRLTEGHRAVVEDKPEVKKAGGVYYTPTYIVDYIVKHTVGALLSPRSQVNNSTSSSTRRGGDKEGRRPLRGVAKPGGPVTPKDASKLRILDPACGSGSFLLGAYQYLLDWHRDWYVKDGPEKHRKELYQGLGGDWRLTTAERKRILLKNIYGVDIDPQAVEVTKLSLLLRVLEGENEETLNRQLRMFHERALPDLGNNIKCGNSLIGPDFYEGQQMTLLDEEERYRINAFDWNAEFPEIMKAGPENLGARGFDAVIGNPPWGALLSDSELEYLRQKNREIIVRMIDSFMYFVHQGIKKLSEKGFFGMILPDVILYQSDNRRLREFILDRTGIHRICNLGDVFEKVTRPACVLVVECTDGVGQVAKVADLTNLSKQQKPTEIWNENHYEMVPQATIPALPGAILVTSSVSRYDIWAKVKAVPQIPLRQLVDEDGIQRGVSPDLKEAFLVDSKTAKKWKLEREKLRSVLTGGKQVQRYAIDRPDLLLIYTRGRDDFKSLANIRSYIDQFRSRISCKEVVQKKHSVYALHRARDEQIFLKKQKFLGVITEDRIVLALDRAQTFCTDGLYVFGVGASIDPMYLFGILNSKLFVFIYRLLALEEGRVLAQVKPTVLNELPIRIVNFSNPEEKSSHDRLAQLAERMLSLREDLAVAKIPDDKTRLEREIVATDRKIDELVYRLYGFTEEETRIVEEEVK